jgi:hypothetical protein
MTKCEGDDRRAFDNYRKIADHFNRLDPQHVPLQNVVQQNYDCQDSPKPFVLLDGPSGTGKTQQLLSLVGFRVVYTALVSWGSADLAQQRIYSVFSELRNFLVQAVSDDIRNEVVIGKQVEYEREHVFTATGLCEIAHEPLWTAGLILALLKHFSADCGDQDCHTWAFEQQAFGLTLAVQKCPLSAVIQFVGTTPDHRVVFGLDEFPPSDQHDGMLKNTFIRSILRACGLTAVLAGTDSTMRNAFVAAAASRPQGSSDTPLTWAYALSTPMIPSAESLAVALGDDVKAFKDAPWFRALVLTSRPLLAYEMTVAALAMRGSEWSLDKLIDNVAVQLFARKPSLRSWSGLLGQWKSFECMSMAMHKSAPSTGSSLITNHMANIRIRCAPPSNSVIDVAVFAVHNQQIVLYDGSDYVVECYYPTPTDEPLLHLVLQGTATCSALVRPRKLRYDSIVRIPARVAMKELSSQQVGMDHRNVHALSDDGDELEQLSVVSAVIASRGSVNGSSVDDFFELMVSEISAASSWERLRMQVPLSLSLPEDCRDKIIPLLFAPGPKGTSQSRSDVPENVQKLICSSQLLRNPNVDERDLTALPSESYGVHTVDRVLLFTGESKSRKPKSMNAQLLKECISKVPHSSTLHFIVCATVPRTSFSRSMFPTMWQVDGVLKERLVKLLVVVLVRKGIYRLEFLNKKCTVPFGSCEVDQIATSRTDLVVVLVPLDVIKG